MYKPSKKNMMVGSLVVLLVLVGAGVGAYFLFFNKKEGDAGADKNGSAAEMKKVIQPRPKVIYDCGYRENIRGWYDFRNQGERNDFCRFVGNLNDRVFSCEFGEKVEDRYVTNASWDANAPHDPLVVGTYGCNS